MAVCCHWCMVGFTGKLALDMHRDHTVLYILSRTWPWQHGGLLTFKVELPRAAWWCQWHAWAFPSTFCTTVHARPALTWRLDGIDCLAWTVKLPWIPVAVSLERICGYRPLCITISQGGTVLGTLAIQRRAHCVHLDHGPAPRNCSIASTHPHLQ